MNNQKGFSAVVLLLSILVITAVGFAGYYVWNQQNKNEEQQTADQQETKKTETASKTETKSADAKKAEAYGINLTINGKEIFVNLADAKYKDIVADLKSSKYTDEAGKEVVDYYYVIYSKNLLARINQRNGNSEDSIGCGNVLNLNSYDLRHTAVDAFHVGEVNGRGVAISPGICPATGDDEKLNKEMGDFTDYMKLKIGQSLK